MTAHGVSSHAASWLQPVRAALDEAGSPRPFFFRDDDAGWRDDRLHAVLDCFQRREVPLDIAVIPAELTPELIRALTARVIESGVRLHQHGYAHLNHEPTGRKCEFGESRDPAHCAQDIAEGQRRMSEAFGRHADPVFTPAWNRCDPSVADILVSLGFEVLSRDSTAPPFDRSDLAEVPITVDWFGHHKGGIPWSRDDLGQAIATSISRDPAVGIMLHHGVTDESDLAAVEELLAIVAAHSHARCTTIMSVAGSKLLQR
jgi:peptidoglycan/xylan/chitin deacetylase (PgdA/CDA1 family)